MRSPQRAFSRQPGLDRSVAISMDLLPDSHSLVYVRRAARHKPRPSQSLGLMMKNIPHPAMVVGKPVTSTEFGYAVPPTMCDRCELVQTTALHEKGIRIWALFIHIFVRAPTQLEHCVKAYSWSLDISKGCDFCMRHALKSGVKRS